MSLASTGAYRTLIVACFTCVTTGVGAVEPFMAGADCSHLAFFEGRGVLYRDGGEAKDALEILKHHGLNCVRLRLFTSSATQAEANPYNYINNLDYTLPLAARVKKAGLQLLLDFHYSDSWADPGKQTKPASWTDLSFPQLEERMYEYNSNTIAAFLAADALPEYVQIGNEIMGGMLWPEGRVGGAYENATQWSQLGRLIKAAARGIKDAAGTTPPKIIIHIDRGGDWSGTQWFFDNLRQQQVQFDIIGESYYPFWHGTLDALRTCLRNAADRYGKPVIVAETAFPWTNSAAIQGMPATPGGQVQFVKELAKIIKSVPGGKGQGIFWWGTEYQRVPAVGLAGFDSRSFFDEGGNALPVVRAFGQLAAPVRLGARASAAGLSLSWPVSGAGMTLETATSLEEPVRWTPVTNDIEHTDAGFISTVSIASETQYFRLSSE